MVKINFDELPDPGERYKLEECIGNGVYGKVFSATDSEAGNKKIAIKIQRFDRENIPYIQEEFRVLHEYTEHQNLPDFYGIFRKPGDSEDEIWFVMELCEGGPIIDLVNGLLMKNRRMTEEHIAFILKETVKALMHLHENHVIHRDIRASNILLTKDGEIKLVDFGLSRKLSSTLGRSDTCIGSPCWMAPEVVYNPQNDAESGYGNRADVWALGITAIELGDGKAPYQDMHPTRAMFQIVRNPPPTLYRPANWSETYNDFINECLVKNPEHRPFIMEVMEHPFLTEVPENSYHLNQELKTLIEIVGNGTKIERHPEGTVTANFFKKDREKVPEKMLVEDLAALEKITEDAVLQELQGRMRRGEFHTFIGDILLILNPNSKHDIYGENFHQRYLSKSRSDNAPHIYAVADSAYQNALHHMTVQQILLAGETGSGKTTNYLHLIDHLLYIGKNFNISGERIKNAIKLMHAFTHASTPFNDYSTRCVIKTEITYNRSGKLSGAIFDIHQLEKWRVSSMDMVQANFHIFYYIYDGLTASDNLNRFKLKSDRNYRYMRISNDSNRPNNPRNNIQQNVKKYEKIQEIFKELQLSDEECDSIISVLAAILILGDVRFKESGREVAEIENEDNAKKVAQLLNIDEKKFIWALTSYCLIKEGTAVKRKHTCDEARDARDVLANTIYNRLVDYVINLINHKLSFGRAIFGQKYSVKILDLFGFECFKKNHLPQLYINCLNEQLHYLYLQRIFTWESLELNEEDVPFTPFSYHDNKSTLDQMLGKEEGIFTLIDEASKLGHGGSYIIDYLENQKKDHIEVTNNMEFSIAHYTGKVAYDAKEMPDRNRDFLPPEVIETLRLSKNSLIISLFANKLTKMGNLYVSFDEQTVIDKNRHKFCTSLSEDENSSKATTEHQYSQIKKMRTSVSTFRALSLELLKELSVGGSTGATHFVRCIRSDLQGISGSFHIDIVRQQLRALAVMETAKTRQRGFPHRISFPEFLRRYKFLAFDFDENVDVTRDNCRLLLVRLKMEGWIIGKSKVCLKYYNEEYLSRLYETQVKKIIKIQSMMRAFLVKRQMAKKMKNTSKSISKPVQEESNEMTEDEAAIVLQKAYRGIASRKAYGPLVSKTNQNLNEETCNFIRIYCKKWKAKSIFQVLLQYRAARYQDMFNLAQQVHLYNQNVVHNLQRLNNNIELNGVNNKAQVNSWLGEIRRTVLKLPFRLDDVPYFDTSFMCDPLTNPGISTEKEEAWDTPFKWRDSVSNQITTAYQTVREEPKLMPTRIRTNDNQYYMNQQYTEKLMNLPYTRDPEEPIRKLSTAFIELDYNYEQKHNYNTQFNNNTNRYMNENRFNSQPMERYCVCDYNNRNNSVMDERNFKHQEHSSYGNSRSGFAQQEDLEERPYGGNNKYTPHNSNNQNYESSNDYSKVNKTYSYDKVKKSSSNQQHTSGGNNNRKKLDPDSGNTKPANKDFEYIRPPSATSSHSVKSNSANPIMELQNRGRKNSVSEDEPPFNFQGMLRKTNFTRESLKRTTENLQYSLKDKQKHKNYESMDENASRSNVVFNSKTSFRKQATVNSIFSTELAPGIFMEGTVADL